MCILEVYRENPLESIGQFSSPLICASYLASLEALNTYRVTIRDNWDNGENWVYADEWLECFINNGRFSGKEPGDYLLSVGTKVLLPDGNYPKHQKRLCVIDAFRPEKGREYAILRGITSQGVSKSQRQVIYAKYTFLETLEICGKYPEYTPQTQTTI